MGRRTPQKPSPSVFSRAWRGALRILQPASRAALPVLTLGVANCYSTGDGTPPPLDQLYFPVGLQVSAGGTALYAINSNFDLQYNGGTIQSYDLGLIRRHVLDLLANPRADHVPIIDRGRLADNPCPARATEVDGNGALQPLGETCAPPVDASFYVRDSAVIGAFATDLLLSPPPARLQPASARVAGESLPPGTRSTDRLFAPVRGNASLTWADIERDGPDSVPPPERSTPYAPFVIQCGQDSSRRCNAAHTAGEDAAEPGNTRGITMPGEPFGMAMSEDGESIIVTHQNETKTSLFSSGLTRSDQSGVPAATPALQFVLDGVPFGGVGAVAIPHDRDAFAPTAAFPRSAFLETSRSVAQISLLRQYPDEFNGIGSALRRPFLDLEGGFPVSLGPGGNDSRGLAIDPTPRLACKAKVAANPANPATGRTQEVVDAELRACARKAARIFVANRTPASLLIGDVGGSASAEDAYDPDRVTLHTVVPLSAGPSKVYLAPVVEADGAYALRVFVVCFDSATIFVYDPDAQRIENIFRVGLGPFAMTFDPFSFEDVAAHVQVPLDPRDTPARGLRRYRFAYLASFTNSFIQVLDLDNFERSATFERIVFTLGRPTSPKGS